MLQLNPPLPLTTPKGDGLAYFVQDLGPEHDLQWTVFLDGSGEIWTFMNRDVRAVKNITMHRLNVNKPKPTEARPMALNGLMTSETAKEEQILSGLNGTVH